MIPVHPRIKRPDPIRVCADSWVDARNLSCKFDSAHYERVGVVEGFVMIPRRGAIVIILAPGFHDSKIDCGGDCQ